MTLGRIRLTWFSSHCPLFRIQLKREKLNILEFTSFYLHVICTKALSSSSKLFGHDCACTCGHTSHISSTGPHSHSDPQHLICPFTESSVPSYHNCILCPRVWQRFSYFSSKMYATRPSLWENEHLHSRINPCKIKCIGLIPSKINTFILNAVRLNSDFSA